MRVETYTAPQALLGAAEPWLLAREAENNIVLASAYLLVEGDHPFFEPYFLGTIVDAGRIEGAAVRTPPDSLHVTDMPPGAASLLVEAVAESHPALPSVSGPAAVVREFADGWARARGAATSVRHRWYLYLLERAAKPRRSVPGELRLARESDRELLREWGPRYARDVNTRVDVAAFLERMMRRRSLYLWDDRGARSLVSMSGRTPRGIRVSACYTPDEYRNEGYASAAVAAATAAALAEGLDFCMLVAETRDAAPNRVYRNLGFVPVSEQAMIDLTVPGA